MLNHGINFLTIPTFSISILLFALGIFVAIKNSESKINTLFSLICLSAAIWLSSHSCAYYLGEEDKALFWFKIGYPGVIFIAVLYFHFSTNFLGFQSLKWIIVASYIIGVLLVYVIWSTKLLISGVHIYSWGYYPKAGRLHPYFLLFFFGLVNAASFQLAYCYFWGKTKISPIRYQQIKYILLAFSVFTVASIDFIPNYGLEIYPLGFIPATIFLLIISYSIVRYRLMDMSIVITRTGIFVVIYSIVLGLPFVVAFCGKDLFIRTIGESWWMVPLISSTVLATVGPFIYLYIQRRAEEQLLQEQRRYQETLRRASAGMGRIKDLKKLFAMIVHVVNRSVGLEYSSVYVYDPLTKRYVLGATRNRPADSNGSIDYDSPMVQHLREVREPIVYEEIKQRTQDYNDQKLARIEEDLRKLDAALVVPSLIEDKLLGIVVLGRKRSGKLFSEDDLNVFSILSNQAALAIENAQFYEEMEKARHRV